MLPQSTRKLLGVISIVGTGGLRVEARVAQLPRLVDRDRRLRRGDRRPDSEQHAPPVAVLQGGVPGNA
jgi:hypothetical protein